MTVRELIEELESVYDKNMLHALMLLILLSRPEILHRLLKFSYVTSFCIMIQLFSCM